MAFWDDIGKKISQAGQTAVQKTKDVADIARINSAISDEDKKLAESYIALGKLYVAKHATDADEAFSPLVATAQGCIARIADYKQQIKDIKGVTICEKCGREIPLGNAFCGSCGAAVASAPAAADKVVCVRCGAAVDKAMRFCTSCGNPMEASAPTAQPVEESRPTVEAVSDKIAPETPAPSCPNCGSALLDGALFCTECGSRL